MRFFCSLVFLLAASSLFAQPVASQAPPEKVSAPYLQDYFASDSSGYYCTGKISKQLYIEKLDSDLVPKKFVSTGRLWYGKRKREYVTADHLGKNLFLFTWGWDGKLKTNFLFGQTIDKTTLAVSTQLTTLLTRTNDDPDPSYFSCHFSNDHSRMLVFCDENKGLNGDKRIHFKVLDDSLHTVWEKVCSIYLAADSITIRQVETDAHGRVFLLVREQRKNGKFRYHCIAIRDQGTFVKDIPLEPHGVELYEPSLDLSDDGSVQVTGFYKGDHTNELAGVFFMKLEKFGYRPVVSVISPFLPEFFLRYATRQKDSSVYVPMLFRVKDAHTNSDNGGTLVAEHSFYQTSRQSNVTENGVDWVTVNHSVFDEIIVFRFNADGTLAWESIVGKKQESDGSTTNMSCIVFFDGDLVRLVYNDNMGYETTRVVTATTVDTTGKSTITPVSGIPEGSTMWTHYACHLEQNELLVYCEYRYEYRKGRIVFK